MFICVPESVDARLETMGFCPLFQYLWVVTSGCALHLHSQPTTISSTKHWAIREFSVEWRSFTSIHFRGRFFFQDGISLIRIQNQKLHFFYFYLKHITGNHVTLYDNLTGNAELHHSEAEILWRRGNDARCSILLGAWHEH